MLARLLDDAGRSNAIRKTLETREPELAFDAAKLAGLKYASQLTLTPTTRP